MEVSDVSKLAGIPRGRKQPTYIYILYIGDIIHSLSTKYKSQQQTFSGNFTNRNTHDRTPDAKHTYSLFGSPPNQ